jgi:hypothetical protein
MRLVLALLVLAVVAGAQEQPIEHDAPYVGECFAFCQPLPDRGVTCWEFGRFPTEADKGPRCASGCQYDGAPYFAPDRDPGWHGCASAAPAGVACNATAYLLDNSRPWRPKVVCDGGQADGTEWP